MRPYPTDSPDAAGRLLALSLIVDGRLGFDELHAIENGSVLGSIGLDRDRFSQLIDELCADLRSGPAGRRGLAVINPADIDRLLAEIGCPVLRQRLLRAMWEVAETDGWLADGEAVLLARASEAWSGIRPAATAWPATLKG
jgi:hypothetical protein